VGVVGLVLLLVGLKVRLWQRARFFFAGTYWPAIFLGGCVLVLFGRIVSPSHPTMGSALVGVGGSMIATMLVSFAGPDSNQTYKTFVKFGVREFYAGRDNVDSDKWVDWLKKAKRKCVLFGVSNGEWLRDTRFSQAVTERLLAGVDVQVFFLDPASDIARQREKEDRQARGTIDRIKVAIGELWEIREALPAATKEKLTIYIYDATASLGVTWIDDWMLVTHYLAAFNNRTSPALRVEDSGNDKCPYAVYAQNVEGIRNNRAKKVTDVNIKDCTGDGS
jgi:hypothetical protein